MSVIVIKKEKNKILIGADTQESSSQGIKEIVSDAKLKKIENEIYVAGAGDAHVCSMLYAYMEENSLSHVNSSWLLIDYFSKFNSWAVKVCNPPEENQNLLERCNFIIIIKNRIWQFADFYIREIQEDESTAIGCGAQAALACMTLTDSFEKVLEAVCKVDIYCSLPINIIEIKI